MKHTEWWQDDEEPPRRTQYERDKILLWWKARLWIALSGCKFIEVPKKVRGGRVIDFQNRENAIKENRAETIKQALIQCQGVQTDAANMLGISRRMISYHIKRHNLQEYCCQKFRRS